MGEYLDGALPCHNLVDIGFLCAGRKFRVSIAVSADLVQYRLKAGTGLGIVFI
jgi:hypothetical protein